MPKHYCIATRAQVLTLAVFSKLKYDEISAITGVPKSTISRIIANAKERGFRGGVILDEHVVEKPRSGRPTKVTPEVERHNSRVS